MIELNQYSAPQAIIIRKICQVQINSLSRLINNNDHCEQDVVMYLIQNEVSHDEFIKELEYTLSRFSEVMQNPDDISILDNDDLSTFRHLLAHLSERYKEKFPNAITNLWDRLFLLEDMQNKSLKDFSIN